MSQGIHLDDLLALLHHDRELFERLCAEGHLDREADRFIAERSGADRWMAKPLEAGELRRNALELLEA